MRKAIVGIAALAFSIALLAAGGLAELVYQAQYGSWGWMFTPPPHLEHTGYNRVDAPEGSPKYQQLIEKYGTPHSVARRWPLPYSVEASEKSCGSSPWVLYLHGFDGKAYAYTLTSGCA
ncbi:hypothetical protein [Nocardia concava]|uniref:hypothetical protein n=1 Tax=Nocardia concava TaxID=257281 RepID=UPI00030912FC|nr:hypothetical protein [Nocardia concava]